MNNKDNHKELSLLTELKTILSNYKLYPRKKFSQSFLINPKLINWHVKFANLKPNDEILEIGAGIGTLTLSLVQKVKKILAVEIDEKLIKVLKDRLTPYKNVEIIQSDILALDLELFQEKKVISKIFKYLYLQKKYKG